MFLGIQQLLEVEDSHKDYLPHGGTSEIFNKEPTIYLPWVAENSANYCNYKEIASIYL